MSAAAERGPVSAPPDAHELYDLARDPREQRDLAAREPARVHALAAELERWVEELEASGRRLGAWAEPATEPHPAHQQEALRALGYLE